MDSCQVAGIQDLADTKECHRGPIIHQVHQFLPVIQSKTFLHVAKPLHQLTRKRGVEMG